MSFGLDTDEQVEAYLRRDAEAHHADLAVREYYERRALGDSRASAAIAACKVVIDLLTNEEGRPQ